MEPVTPIRGASAGARVSDTASRPAGVVAGRGRPQGSERDHFRSRAEGLRCVPVGITVPRRSAMAGNKSWDMEDKWWEQNFSSRPYASGRTYDDFRPAYRYGFE